MLVGLALVGTSFYCRVFGRTKAERQLDALTLSHDIDLKIENETHKLSKKNANGLNDSIKANA
jgi:hypothetical protein